MGSVVEDVFADRLLSVKEAAQFLGLARSTVYQLMETGQLRYVKLGRSRRIPRRELVALTDRNMLGGTAVRRV